MKYNLLDLFSGIGGFHKGFSEAGFEFERVCFSEIDKHAIAVYQHNNPKAEYHGSVTTISGRELRKSESEKWIVTFGSPCQDLSLAGKRKGMGGSRSSLFFEATRIIRELKPDYFIWENVKGAFSSNGGLDFIAVLREIAEIGGYGCQWELCNTRWFLPQNRERIYLVGCLGGCSGREIFPIGEINNSSIQIQRQTSKEQSGVLSQVQKSQNRDNGLFANRWGGERRFDNIQIGTWRTHKDGQGFREVTEQICPTIPARAREDGSGQPVIKIGAIRGRNPDNPTSRKSGLPTEQMLELNENGTSNTLTSVQKDNVVVGDYRYDEGFRKREDGVCPTISQKDGGGLAGEPLVKNQKRIRRLTPIECERLQGFPDNWTQYGVYDGEVKKVSDTQRYKMCGNAVSVPVVKAIALNLKGVT